MKELDYQSLKRLEKEAFEKMSEAFNACKDFEERVSIPHQGSLTDAEKQEEERLNNNYEKALNDFLDAFNKRKEFEHCN